MIRSALTSILSFLVQCSLSSMNIKNLRWAGDQITCMESSLPFHQIMSMLKLTFFPNILFISIIRYITLEMSSKRRAKNCDVDNQQKPFTCVNKFILAKMSCHIPWLQSNSPKKVCTSALDLDEYYNIHKGILENQLDQELKEFGCFLKPNCVENYWIPKTLVQLKDSIIENSPYFGSFLQPNKTSLYLAMLSDEVSFKN